MVIKGTSHAGAKLPPGNQVGGSLAFKAEPPSSLLRGVMAGQVPDEAAVEIVMNGVPVGELHADYAIQFALESWLGILICVRKTMNI